MKKFILSLGAVVALTACGGGGDADPVDEAPAEEIVDETEGAIEDTDDAVIDEEEGAVEEEPAEEEEAGDETAGTADATAARAIYEQSCLACHGGDLEGAMGPTLTGTGLSQEEVLNIINNGQGSMPAVNLDDADAENLAAWISEQ